MVITYNYWLVYIEKYTGQYGDDKHGQISRLSSEQQQGYLLVDLV